MRKLIMLMVFMLVGMTIYCQGVLRYSLDEMYYGRIEYGEITWTDNVLVDIDMTIKDRRIKIGRDVYDIIIQTCKDESDSYYKLSYYVRHKRTGNGYYVTFMIDTKFMVYIEGVNSIIGYNINLVE